MSHSASKPKKAYALILTITLLVSGCSGFGFLFERLDWLMVWQLDRMFDLSSEQEEQIQPKAAELREWLRNEGFPKIIDGFNQTLTLWNADKLEAALDHMDKTTKALTSTFLAQLVPIAQTLSLSLTEENAEHYRHYNEKKQQDWFAYAESDESKADARVEQLEDWFGHLTDTQIISIMPYTKLYPNEMRIRIDNNHQWQERFLAAALVRDAGLLKQWIESPELLWAQEYEELYQHNKEQIASMMKVLLPTLTKKQKRHAAERVLGWIDKMEGTL